MTHSNHRRGSRESLDNDYVILVRGSGVKDRPKDAQKAMEILADNEPIGLTRRRTGIPLRYMKNWEEGYSIKEMIEHPDPAIYVAAVYDDTKKVEQMVQDFKEAELGFSVVVAGVFDNIFDICTKVGTGPHTVNMSMETIGRTELLPEDRILELMTMCGHSLVGEPLAKHLIDRVRKGRITAEEAGLELGKQCVCNYFNQERAAKIIEKYVSTQR
jgi:hypothetical protein